MFRIGVFTYDFPHKKTEQGLFSLLMAGVEVHTILAAPWVKLDFYASKIRINPKWTAVHHPADIARKFNVPYRVVPHNDDECQQEVRRLNLDVGIILGARILRQNIIDAFNVGVINLHPGLLPLNRGLDNVKWAVLKHYKQGVTAHLIDRRIDSGRLIAKRVIPVYPDDYIVDIPIRMLDQEQDLIFTSLKLLAESTEFAPLEGGTLFKAVPPEDESIVLHRFDYYRRFYEFAREE